MTVIIIDIYLVKFDSGYVWKYSHSPCFLGDKIIREWSII